jgi:hypothetical protein
MEFPKYNTVYTFKEIMLLELSDAPFLLFIYNNKECVIQSSHITDESLMNIPGMSESKWCYEKTTHECIPLFWYDDIDIETIVDITLSKNSIEEYWVTPKGYPREQY